MRGFHILLVAVLAVWIAAAPAAARTFVDAGSPEDLTRIVRGHGQASLSYNDKGSPYIEARAGGVWYRIDFHGCDGAEGCRNLRFHSYWRVSDRQAMRVADWSRQVRFVKAYIDGDGDAVLEMDVNLDFGVSTKNFDDTVDWWRVMAAKFNQEIIEARDEATPLYLSIGASGDTQ